MELTMTTGTFEALDQQAMFAVDGGRDLSTEECASYIVGGILVISACFMMCNPGTFAIGAMALEMAACFF